MKWHLLYCDFPMLLTCPPLIGPFWKQRPLVDKGPYISAERSLGNHQSTEAFTQVRSQITSPPMCNSLKHVEYSADVSCS